MKKILAPLLAVMMASALHAASINWTVSLGNKVVKDYSGTANYSSTVYFYLATDSSSLINPDQTKEEFFATLSAIKLNDEKSASSEGKLTTVSGVVVTSPLLEPSTLTDFGMLIVSEDAAGNGFIKRIEKAFTTYTAPASADAQQTAALSWTALGNKSWEKVYSVPEPATGALALAGLALLFRRKRA